MITIMIVMMMMMPWWLYGSDNSSDGKQIQNSYGITKFYIAISAAPTPIVIKYENI